jgi:hypothetical protein
MRHRSLSGPASTTESIFFTMARKKPPLFHAGALAHNRTTDAETVIETTEGRHCE